MDGVHGVKQGAGISAGRIVYMKLEEKLQRWCYPAQCQARLFVQGAGQCAGSSVVCDDCVQKEGGVLGWCCPALCQARQARCGKQVEVHTSVHRWYQARSGKQGGVHTGAGLWSEMGRMDCEDRVVGKGSLYVWGRDGGHILGYIWGMIEVLVLLMGMLSLIVCLDLSLVYIPSTDARVKNDGSKGVSARELVPAMRIGGVRRRLGVSRCRWIGKQQRRAAAQGKPSGSPRSSSGSSGSGGPAA